MTKVASQRKLLIWGPMVPEGWESMASGRKAGRQAGFVPEQQLRIFT